MKDLAYRAPLQASIAQNATTPDPGNVGVAVWSTVESALLTWNGSYWAAAPSTGGGTTLYTGTATLDFGSAPGSNEASVAVSGQSLILATSLVQAFVMADDSSADHTANDHRYFSTFATLSCSAPTSASGFSIYARSHHKLTGQWAVRWVWST